MREQRENTGRSGGTLPFVGELLLLILLIVVLTLVVTKSALLHRELAEAAELPEQEQTQTEETPPPEETPPADTVDTALKPYATEETHPSNLLTETAVSVNGEITEDYQPRGEITFGGGDTYTTAKGIITFRGNNYRDTASYGTADLTEKQFGSSWTVTTGSLQAPDGQVWTGSGWTGQPLVVEWDAQTRRNMNLYDWAKEKDGLTEVIYACMDGYIYFLELDSGQRTRDPINVGYTFKGTASLDPRGYPLLYVGAGYHSYEGKARAFVISLIDGKILYTYGNGDSFALRDWSMFDGSPLIDAETDTLIHPGENGVLYLIHLNSSYDPVAGTVAVDPDEVVKWRYSTTRTGNQYWLGMESSPVVWDGNLILADNGGNLMCVDINTLEPVWVQDVLDDTNCTPVLSVEDGHPYVYVSTSFHEGWRSWTTATIPVWKIDAVSGEVVWQVDYTCYTVSGVSGGTQGTIALGKNKLDDRIFVAVSRTPDAAGGVLAALDKETGEVIWEFHSKVYSWSSPVDFYDSEGNGYLIYTTSGGYMYLIDGATGDILDSMDLGGNIEASAAVYNNRVVVGHRRCQIWGVELK